MERYLFPRLARLIGYYRSGAFQLHIQQVVPNAGVRSSAKHRGYYATTVVLQAKKTQQYCSTSTWYHCEKRGTEKEE